MKTGKPVFFWISMDNRMIWGPTLTLLDLVD